jgi:sugar lactone lactonase YvrE
MYHHRFVVKPTNILAILTLMVLLAGAILAEAQQFHFTTLAGPAGSPGHSDGLGSAARFNAPGGVAADSAGNVYMADTGNHTIRKISPNGVTSTLAGLAQDINTDGSPGSYPVGDYADGAGSAARFNCPRAVAVDSAGNVYVADTGNETIRKISPSGLVSTLAGLAFHAGSVDGTGSAARFDGPSGVAVDSAGNVYVTDIGNKTVRKVTSTGLVSTLAGLAGNGGSTDGTGSAARFADPWGVAVDSAGNVYVADSGNHTIRKMTPGGVVSTLAGQARFSGPHSVAVDTTGNVYVADTYNNTIQKVAPDGEVSTLAGLVGDIGNADGTASDARFNYPTGVAVDSTGNVYVADTLNHTIRKITLGGMVTTPAGLARSFGSADGTGSNARFRSPYGVALDSASSVYIVDSGNHTIRKVTSGAVVSTLAGLAGTVGSADGTGTAARFNYPNDVAVDTAGNVYVADSGNHTIRKITTGGVVSTLAGLAGSTGSADGTGSAARFSSPLGVAVDSAGNVFVADSSNFTIRKITPDGVVSTLAGLAGSYGSADGTGSAARFSGSHGVAVDSAGNIYVADSANRTIRKITPGGVVSTLEGVFGGCNGFGCDGPWGVAVDSGGNVYVTEWNIPTIRKITPSGMVSTLAGLARSFGSADGTGSNARFRSPYGVAVDSFGNVYVTDYGDHTIRLGTPVPITQPALARSSLLRLPNGQFQVEVTASTNQLVLIQATSVLPAADWITLQTGTLSTGRMTFTDPHASSFTVRFYRAISPVP